MGFIGNFTKILEISELSELSHRLGRHQYWPNIYSVIYQFKGNLMDNKVWITSFLKNEIIFFLLFITPPYSHLDSTILLKLLIVEAPVYWKKEIWPTHNVI